MDVHPLRKRSSFVKASSQGTKFITQSFIMLMLPDPELEAEQPPYVRVGYTVTRKMGNAVNRNRIRRRLREAVRACASESLSAGQAYVMIARNKALLCPFSELMRDIRFAAARIGRRANSPKESKE